MSAGSAAKVLVVDDDPLIRELLCREASDAGHPVRSAADAESAVAAMNGSPPDILVTDVRLPGISGLQLSGLVRSLHPETEVILVTGFASLDVAIEGVRLGACDFVVKPFEDLALVRASLVRASARVARRRSEERRLEALRTRSDGYAALLDRLPVAVLLVGPDLLVRARNRAVERLLASGDGLVIEADRLSASSTPVLRAIAEAVKTCCGDPRAPAVPIRLAPEGAGRGLRAVVAPLLSEAIGLEPREPLAAILIDEPQRGSIPRSGEILARLYGLTPAEAEFAARLLIGDSVSESCEALGIAVATGRTHLSRIFQKTGTSRQGDLVGLLLSGPALLAGDPGGRSR